ncbi:ABC transporter permease [Kordiimonas lipolytica]|uniref:ABC transporter permease n=1 Tax=Kordiimonas lipolytica TaxID=1662421 RepID=A0ABV8UEB8_9PROT|nr:iron ABC transporter permease [Kordiimonas lipolytica]
MQNAAVSEEQPFGVVFSRAKLIQYSVAVIALILVAVPLVPIMYQAMLDKPIYDGQAILTLDNFSRLFANPKFYEAFKNSVVLSAVTTVIAGIIGVSTAVFIGRTNIPGKKFFGEVVLWPMYVSHLVLAFGWFMMYGPSGYVTLLVEGWIGGKPWDLYTMAGMAIVAGAAQAPLVHLFCASSVARADASLEDAARTVGAGPFTVLRRVTVPLLRPAITYSAMLNFIGCLEMLSVPLILGTPVGKDFFTTFLYTQGYSGSNPDYGLIGAAACFLLVMISILIYLQSKLLKKAGRFVTVKGKATRPKIFDLGRYRWAVSAVLAVYFGLTLFVTVGGLGLRAFTTFLTPLLAPWELLTLDNFALIFEYDAYQRSITNSLLVAGIGAAFAVGFVSLITVIIHRSGFRFRKVLEYVALYPRAVPGIVAGIGFFWGMLLFPFLGPLHGTIWILILAFTMRTIPTAFGAISPALMQLSKDLDQSSRTVGADWWSTQRKIILPLLRPALFGAYVLLFLSFLKEYASAAFLFAPGSEILGTTMLQFWVNGDSGPVAALAVIQIILTITFVVFARKLLGVKAYG